MPEILNATVPRIIAQWRAKALVLVLGGVAIGHGFGTILNSSDYVIYIIMSSNCR
jgi:hypothetical protein